MFIDLIETAMRNGRRDEANYTVTAPDAEVFTNLWTLTHKTDADRKYFVEVDEAGVPCRCNCPAAKKAQKETGENVCKHQYILAEYIRIEQTFVEAEDLYAKL